MHPIVEMRPSVDQNLSNSSVRTGPACPRREATFVAFSLRAGNVEHMRGVRALRQAHRHS